MVYKREYLVCKLRFLFELVVYIFYLCKVVYIGIDIVRLIDLEGVLGLGGVQVFQEVDRKIE